MLVPMDIRVYFYKTSFYFHCSLMENGFQHETADSYLLRDRKDLIYLAVLLGTLTNYGLLPVLINEILLK